MSTMNVWTYRSTLDSDRLNQSKLIGYEVEATDGSIGKIDDASTETSRQYVVVDTGFWIFGKKRLVPAGVIRDVDHNAQKVYLSMAKDEVKQAPDYEETKKATEDYYKRYAAYYDRYYS